MGLRVAGKLSAHRDGLDCEVAVFLQPAGPEQVVPSRRRRRHMSACEHPARAPGSTQNADRHWLASPCPVDPIVLEQRRRVDDVAA